MILAFGANGQLAKSFQEIFKSNDIFYSSSNDLDLLSTKKIIPYIKKVEPSCIINFSAFNKVDDAEKDNTHALKINCDAVSEMALYCFINDVPIIHFSSDYVFDGQKNRPYSETDSCNPINKYGESKLLGERAIIESKAKFLIFRTSFLYSKTNISFPQIIKNLIENNTSMLKGASNIITSPTYSGNLAEALKKILPTFLSQNHGGIFHFSDYGEVSRFEFMRELISIFYENDPSMNAVELSPVKDSFFKLPASRPEFSVLCCKKIFDEFGISQKDWKSSLRESFLN